LKKNNVLIAAALAFLALLLFIFSEFVFDDSKFMVNSDALNGLGSYYARAKSVIVPEWDDSRLGGLPTLDAIQGSLYHPLALLRFVMDPGRAEGWIFILIIWNAFISAFVLGRYLTDKWQWGALLGFLYAFSPQYFSFIYGGHEGKMMVFGVAPFAMYSLLRLLRESSLKHLIYLSLSIIWMLTSAHLQITYFFLWGAGLFVIFELFSNRLSARVRCIRLGLASLALAIALMICAFQIIPPYLYTTTESVRGTEEKTSIEHSASWSLHSEELAAIILPGFIGVNDAYWGQNHFKLNSDTCGALLSFLALCGCLLPGNRRAALFWGFGCIIALSYAMGLHSFLFAFWYNLIPGIKNFRAPSMSLHWLPLAFIFLAAPVLKNFEKNKKIIKQGAILYGILLVGILFLRYYWESLNGAPAAIFTVLFGAYFIKIQNSQLSTLNSQLKKRAALNIILWSIPFIILASFFLNPVSGSYFKPVDFAAAANLFSQSLKSFALIAAVLAVGFFVLSNSMSITQKALILAAVAAVDLAVINFPFIQNVPGIQYYNPNHPAIQVIKKDSPNDAERPRVYSVTRQPSISGNIFPAYNMRNALGFHDNEIARYRIFREELQNQAMLDLTNVGYIIFDSQIERNPGDLGRAKMYYQWQTENSGDEIIEKLKDNNFNYRNILLLENSPLLEGWQAQPDGVYSEQGNIKIPQAKPGNIIFEVESPATGKLFVSENYHKYWKAKVNGEAAEVYRAFSTFMAVDVPQGKSVVELNYASDSVRISLWIGAAGLILLLGVAVCNVLRFLPKP